MLEKYFEARHTIARFRSSPVGPYIDGFASQLHEWGYGWQAGGSCLRHAVHLGRWASSQHVPIPSIDEDALPQFEAHLGNCRCPYERAGSHERARARALVFLGYLRCAGVIAVPDEEAPPPDSVVVAGFGDWMRRHVGAKESTVRAYSRAVRALVERLGEDSAQYSPQALRSAVVAIAVGRGRSKAEQVVTATRAFLAYHAVMGRCSPDLASSVPKPAAWSQTVLPKHLPGNDVERLLASCNSTTPSGLRDRAIMLLLARLGLRGGDVVDLGLTDVDWRAATVRVSGKGRREVLLPLPQDVGDAILAYLQQGRPRLQLPRLFLSVRPPWRAIASSATISCVVARAIRRAGVDAPSKGAHLLRHSAATSMLEEGASLPTIGAVLRHRSIETTNQYARVDGKLLDEVAQPWLEDTAGTLLPVIAEGMLSAGLQSVAQPWLEVPSC